MKYLGGCHCGAVRFEVDMEITSLVSCNCSICSKKGHLLAFAPENSFKLLKGEEALSYYQFNQKVIHHYFCKICGISPFGKGKTPDGQQMRAINVRCLDDIDIKKFSITEYDGKSI